MRKATSRVGCTLGDIGPQNVALTTNPPWSLSNTGHGKNGDTVAHPRRLITCMLLEHEYYSVFSKAFLSIRQRRFYILARKLYSFRDIGGNSSVAGVRPALTHAGRNVQNRLKNSHVSVSIQFTFDPGSDDTAVCPPLKELNFTGYPSLHPVNSVAT